jgi:hypothetical protein
MKQDFSSSNLLGKATSIIGVAALSVSALSLLADPAQAFGGPFPGRDNDRTTSLGQFRLDLADGPTILSPVLFDPFTVIGRTDPFMDGFAMDANGLPAGIDFDPATVGAPAGPPIQAMNVSDADLTAKPAGFEGPPGTREVHTEILALNLQAFGGGGFAVRVGRAHAPNQPRSLGEVESRNEGNDFPAESYFEVFAEIDLPGGITVFNQDPFVVTNPDLDRFPPRVVYIHEVTDPVEVFTFDGELFGTLQLSGHGIDLGSTCDLELPAEEQTDPQCLEDIEFLQDAIRVPEPSTALLPFLGLGAILSLKRKRTSRKA